MKHESESRGWRRTPKLWGGASAPRAGLLPGSVRGNLAAPSATLTDGTEQKLGPQGRSPAPQEEQIPRRWSLSVSGSLGMTGCWGGRQTVLRTSSPWTLPTKARSSRIPAPHLETPGEGSAVQILMRHEETAGPSSLTLARDDRVVGRKVVWWASSAVFRVHKTRSLPHKRRVEMTLDSAGLAPRATRLELVALFPARILAWIRQPASQNRLRPSS